MRFNVKFGAECFSLENTSLASLSFPCRNYSFIQKTLTVALPYSSSLLLHLPYLTVFNNTNSVFNNTNVPHFLKSLSSHSAYRTNLLWTWIQTLKATAVVASSIPKVTKFSIKEGDHHRISQEVILSHCQNSSCELDSSEISVFKRTPFTSGHDPGIAIT